MSFAFAVMALSLRDFGASEHRRLGRPDFLGKPASEIVVASRRLRLAHIDSAANLLTVLAPQETVVRALDPELVAADEPVSLARPTFWHC